MELSMKLNVNNNNNRHFKRDKLFIGHRHMAWLIQQATNIQMIALSRWELPTKKVISNDDDDDDEIDLEKQSKSRRALISNLFTTELNCKLDITLG